MVDSGTLDGKYHTAPQPASNWSLLFRHDGWSSGVVGHWASHEPKTSGRFTYTTGNLGILFWGSGPLSYEW